MRRSSRREPPVSVPRDILCGGRIFVYPPHGVPIETREDNWTIVSDFSSWQAPPATSLSSDFSSGGQFRKAVK